MLRRVLKNIMNPRTEPVRAVEADTGEPIVLNVGGSSKRIAIPSHYDGWRHYLLDIAPGPDVDIVLDARELGSLDPGRFAAIYCSHNLEHYFRHDGMKVLAGFSHVLQPEGFAEIRVPDMQAVFAAMIGRRMDIDDVLYESPAGPITIHDVIYGWGKQIESSGVDFFAHKQGFTRKRLVATLRGAGFSRVALVDSNDSYEIRAFAFRGEPSQAQRKLLGL